MLIRFVVNNFLSFDEEREFNMLAGSFKTHKHHVYQLQKLNLLKAAAIYGANGAGKSNLIKAIRFLQRLVYAGEIEKSVNDKKFRLRGKELDRPIEFEIEFSKDRKTYAYGLSITGTTVVQEWLYETGIDKDDKLIFERKSQKNKIVINVADKYKKNPKDILLIELMQDNLLKSNELLVSKTDNLKIPEILKFKDWIDNYLIIIFPGSKFTGLTQSISMSKSFKSFANELLQTFDTGVKELDVETMNFEKWIGQEDESLRDELLEDLKDNTAIVFPASSGTVLITKEKGKPVVKKVVSMHHDLNGQPVFFDLNEESDGTQRLLDFIPAFGSILNLDTTFIIDEIDQSLHPVLLRSLVKKVMRDTQTKGQFIFSTHESNLLDLDIFRPDEIWFVEKDKKCNGSKLYSLSEFRPRHDLDIKRGYLKGRFGAIPFLADLENLNWNNELT